MEDLMWISSDHPGQWDFLNADLKKASFKKSDIIYQTADLGNMELSQWLLMEIVLMW